MAAAVVGMSFSSAAASKISSAYTPLHLEECQTIRTLAEGEGSVWICEGFNGLSVRVAEDDLRYFVSYGKNASDQTAARQTLTHFNTIHTALEWRVERIDGRSQPFATILRYFWDSGDNGPKGETLVVTKLGADDACHIAYVKAEANPRANEMARQIADDRARNFDCKQDEPTRRP